MALHSWSPMSRQGGWWVSYCIRCDARCDRTYNEMVPPGAQIPIYAVYGIDGEVHSWTREVPPCLEEMWESWMHCQEAQL